MNNELYHYGVRGMKWGITKEDGSLSDLARSRLQGYDGDFDDSESFRGHFYKAREYADSWYDKYGKTPVNRLRFEYDLDRDVRDGRDWCSDLGLNTSSLDRIYDAYQDYRDSRDWG